MEITSIALAFLAGLLSVLSPCVLPMVPAVTASALNASRLGLWYLAAGLSMAFALAGSLFTYWLLSLDLSPDILRAFSAWLMLAMAAALLIKPLGDGISQLLSRLISYLPAGAINASASGGPMQFVIGASLGLVWLPCVGPTLGTAIALASQGNDLAMAFVVMLSFGIGSALPLIVLAYWAGFWLKGFKASAVGLKRIMAIALLLLGLSVISGADKVLEIWALQILPSWAIDI